MKRTVDACIDLIRPFMTPNMDGPDPLPTDHAGFFDIAAAIYANARSGMKPVNAEALIKEFVEERNKEHAQMRAEYEAKLAREVQKAGIA